MKPKIRFANRLQDMIIHFIVQSKESLVKFTLYPSSIFSKQAIKMGKPNDISSNPDKKHVNPVSKIARLNEKLANSVVTMDSMEDDSHSDLCFTSSTDLGGEHR